MFNHTHAVVEAFTVSIADYVGGVLGISNSINFYELLCSYNKEHRNEMDEAHQKMMDTTIQQAMDAMDAAFARG